MNYYLTKVPASYDDSCVSLNTGFYNLSYSLIMRTIIVLAHINVRTLLGAAL